MPTFLEGSNRGMVKRVLQPGEHGGIVSGDIPNHLQSCLITRVVASEACNTQFAHMLGNQIYVYVFGDKIGELGIAGLSYFDCDAGHEHGVSKAIQWYRARKVSRRAGQLLVTIGTTSFRGYLTDMRLDTPKPDTNMVEFFLSFKMVPGR